MLDTRRITSSEIREIIENIPTARPRGIIYKNAFRYQYLTAGIISEVAGANAPIGLDAIKTEILGIEVVLFRVKTSRKEGMLRPVAIPLEYEPWAKTLLKWFEVHEDTPPFSSLTMRSFQREAGEIFKGLVWPVEEYQKSIRVEATELEITRERLDSDGKKEYLVEYPDGERRWTSDPKIKVDTVIQESHFRPFSLASLRQLRLMELRNTFGFTDYQIQIFTGLSGSIRDIRIPSPLDSFLLDDSSDSQQQFDVLRDKAKEYIINLNQPRE